MKHIFIVGIVVALMLILTGTSVLADSIYDVNFDGVIDAQDAAECWNHRGGTDMTFDVNTDNVIDSQDATLIWSHRGEDVNGDGDTIFDWLVNVFWNYV